MKIFFLSNLFTHLFISLGEIIKFSSFCQTKKWIFSPSAIQKNTARQNTVESSLIPAHDTTGSFFSSQ
jgi:hypothetical protein